MDNDTSRFLLLEFSKIWKLQTTYGILLLILYLMIVTGNLLIIIAVVFDHHLHIPMYFFLMNLAMQDIGSITVIIPKSLLNSLMNTEAISYSGCLCQVFFFVFFVMSHLLLLGVMAYDRYVAICNPLHYEMMMNKKVCVQMATNAWMGGLFYSALYTGNLFTMEFCSRVINQFFCDIPQLLQISCSDSYFTKFWTLIFGSCLGFIQFAVIAFSYVQIFREVFRIPSSQGKQKALSTCLPHLTVICLFAVSGTLAYFSPTSTTSSALYPFISIFYCVVPPLLNPLVYSLRNKELKIAFWKQILNICPNSLCKNHSWFPLFR
ncbi:olfactory receptor 14I1-like [Vipera latastei]